MRLLRRNAKFIAAAVWFGLFGILFFWTRLEGLDTMQILDLIYHTIAQHPFAPVIYVIVYAIRPLTFFPAMWLTIASGSLFGFGLGVVCTVIGENLSAATAYWIAHFFGTPEREDEDLSRQLPVSRQLLREQTFPTVVVLRLTYLPFDLVNYACGLLRVPWWQYFFGTFIGILPPMITFVSFGATVDFESFLADIDGFDAASLINQEQLVISAGLLALSAVIAWYAYRRAGRINHKVTAPRRKEDS
jgi:uncharacterized membrane protein YdjX (TVP38/TMEM64 family)